MGANRTSVAIVRFSNEYRFLSNFYPVSILVEDHAFDSVEHAYQAHKTGREDWPLFNNITPGQAKRLGRRLQIRSDWDQVKLNIMLDLLRKKFTHALAHQLLATGDLQLIEGNTWGDVYWGVCAGEGENHLGKLLMQVRDALRQTV